MCVHIHIYICIYIYCACVVYVCIRACLCEYPSIHPSLPPSVRPSIHPSILVYSLLHSFAMTRHNRPSGTWSVSSSPREAQAPSTHSALGACAGSSFRRREGSLIQPKWVWVKMKPQQGTAGFGPSFRLRFHVGYLFLTHCQFPSRPFHVEPDARNTLVSPLPFSRDRVNLSGFMLVGGRGIRTKD